jgi:hypothetical protein
LNSLDMAGRVLWDICHDGLLISSEVSDRSASMVVEAKLVPEEDRLPV